MELIPSAAWAPHPIVICEILYFADGNPDVDRFWGLWSFWPQSSTRWFQPLSSVVIVCICKSLS